jgi:hypothetical protein
LRKTKKSLSHSSKKLLTLRPVKIGYLVFSLQLSRGGETNLKNSSRFEESETTVQTVNNQCRHHWNNNDRREEYSRGWFDCKNREQLMIERERERDSPLLLFESLTTLSVKGP